MPTSLCIETEFAIMNGLIRAVETVDDGLGEALARQQLRVEKAVLVDANLGRPDNEA